MSSASAGLAAPAEPLDEHGALRTSSAGRGPELRAKLDARLPARLQARAALERLLPGAATRPTSSSSPSGSRASRPDRHPHERRPRARGRRDRLRHRLRRRRPVAPMRDRGARRPRARRGWRDGPTRTSASPSPGFPNLFLLYGPNTGLGHNSMIFMIEAQARYVLAQRSKTLRDRSGSQRSSMCDPQWSEHFLLARSPAQDESPPCGRAAARAGTRTTSGALPTTGPVSRPSTGTPSGDRARATSR